MEGWARRVERRMYAGGARQARERGAPPRCGAPSDRAPVTYILTTTFAFTDQIAPSPLPSVISSDVISLPAVVSATKR